MPSAPAAPPGPDRSSTGSPVMQDPYRPTFPLERGWLELDAKDRAYLVARVVRAMGPNGKDWKTKGGVKKNVDLTGTELIDLLAGRHGPELQRDFVLTVVGGMPRLAAAPDTSFDSFAKMCLREKQVDFLCQVASIPAVMPEPLAQFAWHDALGWVIRKGEDGKSKVSLCPSLLRATLSPDAGLEEPELLYALDRILELNPEHHDITDLMAEGGPAAAFLARALMLREVKTAAAAAPALPAVNQLPAAPRRRRAGI